MIAGPITPRNRMGALDLVRQRAGVLERGLSFLHENLELGATLGSSCVVDALLRDAVGTPVLVFAPDDEDTRELPGRILEAECWYRRHGQALQHALPDVDLATNQAP